MKNFIRIKNGSAVKINKIPQLSFETFVEELPELLVEGNELLACFISNQPTRQQVDKFELITAIGCRATKDIAILRCTLSSSYPSLTCNWPQFHLFEREMAEQFGVVPKGHPWLKPVRFHQVWQNNKDVWGRDVNQHPIVGEMEYFQVKGDEIHEVGVGPVHAGIIEPGHFRFQCFGEKVLNLEISLGFQHRGTERLFIGGPHPATVYQMEALAGDTTSGHTQAYSQVMEGLAAHEISQQVHDLRVISLELERIANHVGDIGAMALDVGYLPTSSFCGRLRGDYLNMTALICGSRFGRGIVRPGTSLFQVDSDLCNTLRDNLKKTNIDTRGALKLFFKAPSVLSRLETTGIVQKDDALDLGLTGVAGRACGLDTDSRRWYPNSSFHEDQPLLTGEYGDVFSRAQVRKLEIDAATDLILKKLAGLTAKTLPDNISTPQPDMLAFSLVEGWRGRIAHIALTDDQGKFKRYKVIDPSFFNWSGLAMSLRDEQISDFPICNKSFNLSYCGFDL